MISYSKLYYSDYNGIELEINNKKIAGKSPNIRKLNNILLNTTKVKEDSREKKNYFELNENKNTTYQNLWDLAKAIVRGKFIALKTHIRKEESAKINNLSKHLL